MVPDIAAFADASPGYPIVCSSGVQGCKGSGQSIAFVGGTSAAAPLVAGMIALWNQQARNQGLPRPGFVAPLLTSLAQHTPQTFTDITQGTNALFGGSCCPTRTGLRPGHRLGLAGGQRHRVEPSALTPPATVPTPPRYDQGAHAASRSPPRERRRASRRHLRGRRTGENTEPGKLGALSIRNLRGPGVRLPLRCRGPDV